MPKQTTTWLYRVERKAICIFRFILEGYDNVAVVETLDSPSGLIGIHIAPGCESLVEAVIADLAREYVLEPADISGA